MSKWEATILDSSPRAAAWLEVFGTDTVAVLSPWPIVGDGPEGPAEFYRLDVGELTVEQRERLVQRLADRFSMERQEVEHLMDDPNHGVPILAADVSLPIPARYLV